jgi:hypothetical protein
MSEALVKVACAGCRKPLGVSRTASRRLYCTEQCAADFPVSANESRDDLIFQLFAKDDGRTKGPVAEHFGVSRQRIIQISQARAAVSQDS